MSKPSAKVTIPEVIDRFRAYHHKNLVWGSLHVVLDDLNLEDGTVKFCEKYAEENGDKEGAELARILLQMSRSQRKRLAGMA